MVINVMYNWLLRGHFGDDRGSLGDNLSDVKLSLADFKGEFVGCLGELKETIYLIN